MVFLDDSKTLIISLGDPYCVKSCDLRFAFDIELFIELTSLNKVELTRVLKPSVLGDSKLSL